MVSSGIGQPYESTTLVQSFDTPESVFDKKCEMRTESKTHTTPAEEEKDDEKEVRAACVNSLDDRVVCFAAGCAKSCSI